MEDNSRITENLLRMYSRQDFITRFNYWLLYILSGFRDAPRDSRVLDCGCAIGMFINYLKSKGFTRVEGFDAAPQMVEAAQQLTHCSVHLANVLEMGTVFEQGSFDIVSVSNLIHHITNEDSWETLLQGVRHVLKPGGMLVIREPKQTWIYRTMMRMAKKPYFFVGLMKFRLQSLVEERHYLEYFFARWPRDHVSLLARNGFTIVREGTSLGEQVLTCRREA